MGKIEKTMQAKHRETMSPYVKDFVQVGASLPPAKLPDHLSKFPTRWPFPRGDLFHWIPLLNHFDSIIDFFCKAYKLHDGPQIQDFQRELLQRDQNLEIAKDEALKSAEIGDEEVILSILNFSRMLLENCGNRSLYNSSSLLNSLLNSTSLSLLENTLLLSAQLAQRYQASLKRLPIPSRTASNSLLANHYNIELDRVQQLALPFVKTTVSTESVQAHPVSTPSAKGKEKAVFSVQSSTPASAVSCHANDLVSLVKNRSPESSPTSSKRKESTTSLSNEDWEEWGNVRLTYYTKSAPKAVEPVHTHALQSPVTTLPSGTPSTPTQPRRLSNLSPLGGQRANRTPSYDESPLSRSLADNSPEDSQGSLLKVVEIPSAKLTSSSVHQVLEESLESVPKESQYELLTKVRVARAMTSSLKTRTQILAVRLLAITNLAYIHTDSVFQEKVLKQDQDEPRRLQLIFQLAELVHPPTDGHTRVPIALQTIALNALVSLTQHTNRFNDISTALNTSVNHGIFLYIVRKAVADMAVDDDGGLIANEEDEWRKALLQLLTSLQNNPKTAADIVTAGLLPILVEVLTLRTNIARRHHHMIVQFLDSLVYSARDALQTLVNADGLDAISDLIIHEVGLAMEARVGEKAGPETSQDSFRSSSADYKLIWFQQQTMRWLLKFIHHMMGSAGGFGGNFDRLLRNLIDSPKLLGSLREIISNGSWFGSVVWTNAVTILNDFINNEPTSFAIIAEAGLGKALLEEVSGEPVISPPTADHDIAEGESPSSPISEGDDENEHDNDDEDFPTAVPEASQEDARGPRVDIIDRIENRTTPLASGIMPSSETISIIPQAFGALCLNTNGMRMLRASSALQKYFEIFLSPKHVALMTGDSDLAGGLGGNFDELVRHHPPLRTDIINAVLDMVRGVNHLCKKMAAKENVGAKLWAVDSKGKSVIADEHLNDPVNEDSMDVEMTDSTPEEKKATDPDHSATPYVTAASSFLYAIFGNSSVRSSFIERGGIEHVLQLAQLPSLAYDFGDSRGCSSLQQVLNQLTESKPHLVLPSLVHGLQDAADVLKPFSEHLGPSAYFAPFIAADGPLATKDLSNGTALVKALTNVHSLVLSFKECLGTPVYSHSRSPTVFNSINLADLYETLIKSLGPLLGAAIHEELILNRSIPEPCKSGTSRPRETRTSNHTSETPTLGQTEEDPISPVLGNTETQNASGANSSAGETRQTGAKKEQDSPQYQNSRTLRFLVKAVVRAIKPTFYVLSKVLLNKRHDQFQKQCHTWIAGTLVDTVLQQLKVRKFETDVDRYSFSITMIEVITDMLIDSRPSDKPNQSLTLVLKEFKTHGGFDTLNNLLDDFAQCVCDVEKRTTSPLKFSQAEKGLCDILQLYGKLSVGRNVAESTQAVLLASRGVSEVDHFHFLAHHFVVEIRMAILPSVRRLWESEIIEKGSSQISNHLISIIRHIATADFETGALKRSDNPSIPAKSAPKKFKSASDQTTRLKSQGYSDDLILEALFRCNNNPTLSSEYCEFHKSGRAGKRNPPPPEVQQPVAEGSTFQPPSQDDSMALDNPREELDDPSDGTPQLPDPFLQQPFAADPELAAAMEGPSSELEGAGHHPTASHQSSPAVQTEGESKLIFVEDLNAERAAIREKLIDRSLDIINAHGDVTFEIADLIRAVIHQSHDSSSMRKEMGETLVNALMSFVGDDDVRPNGKKIAAYAHLLALMLQEQNFYNATLGELKDNLSALISFVKVSPDHTSGESSPWIAQILLIVEILLCDDAQPKEAKWTPPTTDSPPVAQPFDLSEPSVSDEEKYELFTAILDILPRVGKDSSLALAILRILVILTRTRSIAQSLGEKKNIQRLFVLAKGLSGSISERLQSPLLIILRHIIEDDDTIKQIMRAEIKTYFSFPRSSQRYDLSSYIKANGHLAIRSPKIFVEVTNELVKFNKWTNTAAAEPSRQTLVLKEVSASSAAPKLPEDPVLPTVQATEDLTLGDVKASTEATDSGAVEKPKSQSEHKAPVVENPDGVIYFLLSELLNYREVGDRDASAPKPEAHCAENLGDSIDSDMPDAAAVAAVAPPVIPTPDAKDKKSSKQEFKPDEHPIYIYRCLLLQCLTELLSSYNRTKIEFINYKRNAPLSGMTPSKPRSSVINYLLFDLIPVGSLEHPETTHLRKKQVTSMWADSVLCALLAKTGEQVLDRGRDPSDGEDEPDLLFVRRFVLENILKAYKEASSSTEPLEMKYSRMLTLADLMNHIMAGKENQNNILDHTHQALLVRSQAQLKRIMYEKSYISALTSSIADIDLNFPGAKRAVKYILRPLKLLTQTAIDLSESSTVALPGQSDDVEISSASSVSDADEREETPDLFRNSALGMFEGGAEEESSSESGDDDQDMYDDGYDEDEMDYEEEMDEDDEDNVSEEDPDIAAMGEIEGLSGDVGIEIEMSDDDEEEEDEEDEDDEDDEDEEDDDEDMDDIDIDDDARVEIIDDIHDHLEGDEDDDWESHEDEEDYEGHAEAEEVEEEESAAVMDHVSNNIPQIAPMIQSMMEDVSLIEQQIQVIRRIERIDEEGLDPADLDLEGYIDDEMNEEDEEEEDEDDDMDEDVYGDFPSNAIPARQMALGWDSDIVEPPVFFGRGGRPRHGMPPPFPMFPSRDALGGRSDRSFDPFDLFEPRLPTPAMILRRQDGRGGVEEIHFSLTNTVPGPEYIGGGRFRTHRPGGAPPRNADDGVNPLLQRNNASSANRGEVSVRATGGLGGFINQLGGAVGRDFLDMALTGRGPFGEQSLAFLSELLSSAPPPAVISRNGHALHFHVSGPPDSIRRDMQTLFGVSAAARANRNTNREVPPNEAVSFSPQSTTTRWLDEAKLLFNSAYHDKVMKILNSLLNVLVPPAWEAEKIAQAAEKERLRKAEEERKKREEEERIAREAKEAEEKAERERKEAEERERRAAEEEAAAANASREDSGAADTNEAMDGVEPTAPATEAATETPAADRPRITTMIRGSPYDITDLGIDPEFLNELPEEIKEEVIMSAVADRRSQAAATGAQPSEIDREFLDALPADIRDEIVQQERLERRRREREEARRSAAASGSGGPSLIPQDMDAASIFATMSPSLRQQVLMEQDEETIAQLPAELAAQARALVRQHHRPIHRDGVSAARREELREAAVGDRGRPQRRTIVEMLDKSGVATLLRLMFVLQQPSLRTVLCGVLQNVCANRNNRAEVISTLLLILQDGSADMSAVERGFAQLSLRAKSQQVKDKDGKDSKDPKTPTLLKRSSTGFSFNSPGLPSIVQGNIEISPLVVIQQCLNALSYLSNLNPHIASFFLTEHESTGGLKRSLSRKGKSKESKAGKYALNSLLSLLDRNLIMESSSVMEHLSEFLARITSPLTNLERKQKETAEEMKKAEEALKAAEALPICEEPTKSATNAEAADTSEMQVEQSNAADTTGAESSKTASNADESAPAGDNQAVSAEEKEKKVTAAKEAKEAALKKQRSFSPPVIPEHNLKLVINIFVARECSSKTFRETLSTIKNLSTIPGAKEAFGRELVRKAQALGEVILVDLVDLLPQIQKASTGTEIQGVALAKFSPASADQNKLLRVLTALDHLFDQKNNSKREGTGEGESRDEGQKQDLLATDLLASLYENSTFGPMWEKLSACLTAIRQREHMLNIATILLPLVESLMVVCKNTPMKETPISQPSQEMSLTSPPPESRMDSLFFTFTEEHRKILNDLVRHSPKLMSGTFSLLVKNPKVLEFDNKRNYFNRSIHNRNQQTRVSFPPLQLSVRRGNVFHDSYKSLAYKSPDEMKYGKLSIRFHGEEGVDAGGVTREWFQVLCRQMFDAGYALFVPVSSDRTTFHPNLLSGINQEHLSFFKFIGRVIGKALFEGRVLDCHFSRAVYKRILGKSVSIKDMESLDPDYYKSLTWMLSNDITDIITETFSVENERFGVVEIVDLKENGRNEPVTEENKQEYVKLVVEHKLQKSVEEQLNHFLTGFHEIIPAELVAIFNENELELLISGLPDIDVDDWKSNTEYHNYSAASPQIQWFWRAVRSFDKEERAKLLQFVTGTSKVPLNGFKELEGMNGFSRFNIHRDYGSKDRLPSSHTCFNQLDLPEYESYESLRQHLLTAITTGSEYFGFA